MGQKLIITEEEKKQIHQMYNPLTMTEYIFNTPHISIDGRFLIYNDELFDYSLNENLGNLFSIKNLKIMFNDINPSLLEENHIIVNKINTILNNIVITENLLKEEINKSFKNRLLLEQDDSVGGLLLKGVLWFARQVKDKLWSIGGMAVDAFLVASGIGKSVQWIPWAICFGLDVYEWVNNDYANEEDRNSSPLWKALNVGFDIMGMMTTGPVAKAAKWLFKPIQGIKSEIKIAQWISKSPKALAFVQKLNGVLSGVGGRMNQLIQYLTTKMPKLAKWLTSMSSGFAKIVNWVGSLLEKIIKLPGNAAEKMGNVIQGNKLTGKTIGKGLKTGVNTTGTVLGVNKGFELYSGVNVIQTQNMKTFDNVIKTKYNGKDPFDI